MFSVVIPCFNEGLHIAACLRSVWEQVDLPANHGIEIIVAANGCRDDTVAISRTVLPDLEAKGFQTRLIDLERPSKAAAMNAAETLATWGPRLFLDADVVLSERVFAALCPLLCSEEVIYCSGRVRCVVGDSFVSRAYARVWSRLPFIAGGVAGVGLYGVSAAGRSRWTEFPDLHSDDRFTRLLFAPAERKKVDEDYFWPVPLGLVNLIKVRRRWIEGNLELFHRYPSMRLHDDKKIDKVSLFVCLLKTPVSSLVFIMVWAASYALARLKDPAMPVTWRRGRN